ncbi:hypothetical protein H6503_05190 [Candidatus Woesearchaeota archaeon]|nr:hypothetical protein [Candidatus Woesearchaeota archaeon]
MNEKYIEMQPGDTDMEQCIRFIDGPRGRMEINICKFLDQRSQVKT